MSADSHAAPAAGHGSSAGWKAWLTPTAIIRTLLALLLIIGIIAIIWRLISPVVVPAGQTTQIEQLQKELADLKAGKVAQPQVQPDAVAPPPPAPAPVRQMTHEDIAAAAYESLGPLENGGKVKSHTIISNSETFQCPNGKEAKLVKSAQSDGFNHRRWFCPG